MTETLPEKPISKPDQHVIPVTATKPAKVLKAFRNKILVGNALEMLESLPDGSINCGVTSPPYFDQRDYGGNPLIWGGDPTCDHVWKWLPPLRKWTPTDIPGPRSIVAKNRTKNENRPDKGSYICEKCKAWKGELGLEPLPSIYINNLCLIFDVLRRKLRNDGTFWVNIGDKHMPGKKQGGEDLVRGKSYFCIPERFVTEMVKRGWILREKHPWEKSDPMPGSQNDRDTVDFEMVYFFVKNNRPLYHTNKKTLVIQREKPLGIKGTEHVDWEYGTCDHCEGTGIKIVKEKKESKTWFDLNVAGVQPVEKEEVREEKCKYCGGTGQRKKSFWDSHDYYYELQHEPAKSVDSSVREFGGKKRAHGDNATYSGRKYIPSDNKIGRVARTTWHFGTNKYPGEHHATFPPELPRRAIKRGCPREICKQCGLPKQPVVETEVVLTEGRGVARKDHTGSLLGSQAPIRNGKGRCGFTYIKKKSIAVCSCNAGFLRPIVVDPFAGSGTTLKVAFENNMDYVGVEINPKYAAEARKNIGNQMRLF